MTERQSGRLGAVSYTHLDVYKRQMKYNQKHGLIHNYLQGKTLAMIFEKNSTRTRVSFEVGMYQLGGHALFLSGKESQIGRGEPIEDTARVLDRYCDGIKICIRDRCP